MIKNQRDDHIFGPIYHGISTNTKLSEQYQYNISQFYLRNKVLHRETIISLGSRTEQTLVQVVIPEVMIPQILFILHDSYITSHGGVERTMRYIQAEYFVHKLRNHVELYIKTCIKFAQHRVRTPIFQYPVPLEPFYQKHLDILGPYRVLEDKGRGRYLLKNLSTDVNNNIRLHEDQLKLVHEQCVPRESVPKVRTPYPHLMVGRETTTKTKIVRENNYVFLETNVLPVPNTEPESQETANEIKARPAVSRPHTRSRGPVQDLTSVYFKT